MIVFYKNYRRTERVLLSIQSVRHLFPEMDIRCLNLYKEDPTEYDSYLHLFEKFNVTLYSEKKTYDFGSSGADFPVNGFYFTEGINKIQRLVKDLDEKVFILDEDQFFTTGDTIKFLQNTDFDLAYSFYWAPPAVKYNRNSGPNGDVQVNGAFLAINPKKLDELFPIVETEEYIEILLGAELYDKCIEKKLNVVTIPTRYQVNYYGDGVHTNDINVIKNTLHRANIPFEL